MHNIIKSSLKGLDMPGGEDQRQQLEQNLTAQGQQMMIPSLAQWTAKLEIEYAAVATDAYQMSPKFDKREVYL